MESSALVHPPVELCAASLPVLARCSPALAQPKYDREKVISGIVHIGIGNFHRAHQAVFTDDIIGLPGNTSWGVTGIGLLPGDAHLLDALRAQDGLYTLWQRGEELGPKGSARIIGCHTNFILAPDEPEAALQALSAPATKIVTLTITEKGYFMELSSGKLDMTSPPVSHDIAMLRSGIAATPNATIATSFQTAAGYIVAAARRRMVSVGEGFTVLSCDNVQENGTKTRVAVLETAEAVDPELAEWIKARVTFPNSMVDRITPATTEQAISELSAEFQIKDRWPVICESFLLWVVEDNFSQGRPAWENSESGKCLIVRDVLPYELMKLRLLNGVHQALSYPAALLGHELVHEAMQDSRVCRFLKTYMKAAGRTVPPVEGIEQAQWQTTVLRRFSNPAILDTIFRLTEDATNRMAVALAPCLFEDAVVTISGGPLSAPELEAIALPITCWIRCLVGDSAGVLPHAARLNRDGRGDDMRQAAYEVWKAVAGKEETTSLGAQNAAGDFLRHAFDDRVARAEVCKTLVSQLKLLQSEGGLGAAFDAVCGDK
eukprot:TRINITY_DN15442_c0_g1_i1.p1 TRINITY_DN15442_c0_g1~~TRINITY_DN15442_c0_g1_i1.p1  ORF type:complete len:564 (-),score=77.59 TRINITY_DN15442_c0_g1_i1:174-1814(-)